MRYFIPSSSTNLRLCESRPIYEIDLVKQWFSILPGTKFKLTNQESLIVINPGELNRNEGPDIKDAMLIINGELKIGNVECHINASDWFIHRHHHNNNFNNVILHTVRKANPNLIEPNIPTLILEESSNILNNCNLNNDNTSVDLIKIIYRYSHRCWQKKVTRYFGYHDNYDLLRRKLINNNFSILGVGGNKDQFLTLAKAINFEIIADYAIEDIEAYLNTQNANLNINWKKRGIRPAQQPQNRMRLAAEIIRFFIKDKFGEYDLYSDLENYFINNCPSARGKGIHTELMGNVIVPYLASRALFNQKTIQYELYFKMWDYLKLPLSYQKYQKRFNGIISDKKIKSFPILQGLIEVDREWCENKICNLCPLKRNHDYR